MPFLLASSIIRGTLKPGTVSEDMFHILIDISAIRSEKVIYALRNFFVDGKTRKEICEEFDVNPGYLSTKIKELQLLMSKIVSIYPYYNHCIKMDIIT